MFGTLNCVIEVSLQLSEVSLTIAILASIFTLLVDVLFQLETTVENDLKNEQQSGCTDGLVAIYLLTSWSRKYNWIMWLK